MKLSLSLFTVSCLAIFLTGSATAHADTFAFAWESAGELGIGSGGGTPDRCHGSKHSKRPRRNQLLRQRQWEPDHWPLTLRHLRSEQPLLQHWKRSPLRQPALPWRHRRFRPHGSGFSRHRPCLRKRCRGRFLRRQLPPIQLHYQFAA